MGLEFIKAHFISYKGLMLQFERYPQRPKLHMKPTYEAARASASAFPSKRRDRTTLSSLFSNHLDPTDINSWNSIIADLSRGGDSLESLRAFASLRHASLVNPNRHTFPCALKSCSSLLDLFSGRQIHQQALKFGYSRDLFVSSSLIDVYAKCREPRDARMVFDEMPVRNVVCWTSMINGCFLSGQLREGVSLFKELLAEESESKNAEDACIILDPVAVGSVISASGDSADCVLLTSIHALVVQRGFEEDSAVGNTLMDAYAKCGYITETKKLFGWMIEKDNYSWNVMIASFAQNGMAEEALEVFTAMVEGRSCDYTQVTLSAVLLASAHLGALRAGKCVHNQVVKMNLENNVVVGTSVVDMYCKCGRVEFARRAFERVKEKNVRTWTAMIAGYGMNGYAREALDIFYCMLRSGVSPNYITFVSVLAACSHAGLVDDAWYWFNAMLDKYRIEPGVEHYGCIVDLLGRAGYLDRAYDLIKRMKVKPDVVVWGSLLGACRIHKNVDLAEISANKLFELEPETSAYYILLCDVYADANRWKDVERMRAIMNERGIVKTPGFSLVELKGTVHTFLVGDKVHPQHEKIYRYLEELSVKLQEAGYVPNTAAISYDVEEEEKESAIRVHSEKLAVAFGVMNSSPGSVIQVIKNLRVCPDCHTVIKLMSKIVNREIIVRDAKRFHHFRNGLCSCGDYW